MTQGKILKNRFKQMESDRRLYEDTFQDISDYIYVSKGDFQVDRAPGQRTNRKVYDTTATQANNLLAATLHGGLTNGEWMGLHIKGQDQMDEEVPRFLQYASESMLNEFNILSNFQSQVHEVYSSLTSLGTACMFIERDENTGSIQFSTIHLSEIYIAENKYGIVDTVFRKFKLTGRQILQKFNEEDLSEKLKKAIDEKPDSKHCLLHCVMPSKDAGKDESRYEYASYYMEHESGNIIEEKGFFEMPYVVPRFEKLSGEIYGRSPGWHALPTIRMVNAMSKSLVRIQARAADPNMLISDDGVMMPLDTRPGGMIVGGLSIDGTPRVSPLQTGSNPTVGIESTEYWRKAIRDMFFIDQLIFRDGPAMTATEVIQRQQEQLRLLSPHLGRIISEFLKLVIDRVFGLKLRAGDFGEIPLSLEGIDIDIEYKSPLIKLQKSSDIQAIQRFIQNVAPIAQINPEVMDRVDFDSMVKNIAESSGIDLSNLRTEEQVQQMREQRQQAQQAQQMLQGGEQAAGIVDKISKAEKNLTE